MGDPNEDAPRCLVCGDAGPRFFLKTGGWNVVLCATCSHRQLDPLPDETVVAALYDRTYFDRDGSASGGYADYVANAKGWTLTARRRIRRLKGAVCGTRILDVGAACGFFVAEARAQGYDAQGVEISDWAAAWARNNLGVPVSACSLEEVPVDPPFDVVAAWEVIEHVVDPVRFVRNAVARLAPGGLLLLSTPDCSALVPRVLGSRWMGWKKVPEHVSFFSRVSLLRLLHDCGLEVVAASLSSTYVSVDYILDRIVAQLGRPGRRRQSPMGGLTLPVNPGWDLEVIARVPRQ